VVESQGTYEFEFVATSEANATYALQIDGRTVADIKAATPGQVVLQRIYSVLAQARVRVVATSGPAVLSQQSLMIGR
jgi:hypothetical protein